jgi:hypothetical protein
MQSLASRFGKLTVLSAALFSGAAAWADISDVIFRISATNDNGTSVFEAIVDDPSNPYGYGYWNADYSVYTWQMTQDVPLSNGAIIMAHDGATASGVTVHNDPMINMGFAVQAGPSATTFTIDSALLSFTPIPSAVGSANAVYTVTDVTPGGVTLTGNGPTGGAYLAQFNGFVPGGTTFTEQIASVSAPSGGSNSASFNDPGIGHRPIGGSGTASDMSASARFTLSRFDLASGTTNYEIVPEPTTALLLLPLAAFALRRRS